MRPIDPPSGAAANPQPVRRAAENFTAVALNELLAPMFDGLSTQGPFGGGAGERTFRPLLIAELARHIAAAGGLGLTETVLRQMLSLQEQKP